jgi:hypothetical protein
MPDTGKSTVKVHCMTGYYGFLDYAAASWWKHARRLEASRDTVTLRAIVKLADALNPQDEEGPGTAANDVTAVWTRLRQGSDDGRDWEHDFPIGNRIRLLRDHLEEILGRANTGSQADLARLAEFYGRLGYKCSKPWCNFFQDSFETASARDDHVRQHELPFRCSVDGCYRFQIGFARESELARHNKRLHSEAIFVVFPSDTHDNIFKAAIQGQLEVIQDLVSRGTSVNSRNKNGSTPLFLAARAGNCQICRWLLEHGADVDARCTTQRLTALHEAVANDDVEIALLLIVVHGADIYVRTGAGESMQTLMEQKRCIRVREAFPPEFWNRANPIGKIRCLKKKDGEPLLRKDIQYDFLKAVFDDERKEFTNSYESDKTKQCFADLYIDTMSRSSRTGKVLRDKLLSDRDAAKGMAMVCFLVNIGRMNATLHCQSPNASPLTSSTILTYSASDSFPRDAIAAPNIPRHPLHTSPPGTSRVQAVEGYFSAQIHSHGRTRGPTGAPVPGRHEDGGGSQN